MTVEEENINKAAQEHRNNPNPTIAFISGAKSPEAKAFHTKGMYSEEEVKVMIKEFGYHINRKYNPQHPIVGEVNEWFEQNKKK